MGQLAYAFSLTLLHSLWQSALLLLGYTCIKNILKKHSPAARRNMLFVLLLSQFCISLVTFIIYYSGPSDLYNALLESNFSAVINEQPFLQLISPWIMGVYFLIIIYKGASILYHWNKFVNCMHTWVKPSLGIRLFTTTRANEFGIRRKVSIWFSNNITSPVTYGFFKPIILIPVALLNQLTMVEAETLIVHELTHIKNNDYLLNFLLITMDTLFFFNPAIKMFGKYIRLEREKNCDVQVIHFKYSPVTYAETLLKAARLKPVNSIFQLAAVSRKNQLLSRILYFTNEANLDFKKRNLTAVNLLLIILISCINVLALTQINKGGNNEAVIIAEHKPVQSLEYNYATLSPSINPQNDLKATFILNSEHSSSPDRSVKQLRRQPKKIKSSSSPSLAITNTVQEENYIYPVSLNETPETEAKEVIIKEEEAGSGNSVTRAYRMKQVNGRWIAEPMWMFTETKLQRDSLQLLKDTVIRPFHIVQ